MSELGRYDQLRVAALQAAAIHGGRHGPVMVIREAQTYLADWLAAEAVRVSRAPIVALVTVQGSAAPPRGIRKEHGMWQITDNEDAQFPARTATDAKGFPVDQPVVLTTDDDTNQQFVTRTDNEDGSTTFSAKAPGAVQLTWTCGDDQISDTLNVTTGAAVAFSDVEPVITEQS